MLQHIIYLLAHNLAHICKILAPFSVTQLCVYLKKWQHALGELRSIALNNKNGSGLFSVLQKDLKTSDGNIMRNTTHTQEFLQDFHFLVEDVGARLTAIE
jgi:hypothetical protein